jgi:hypothetical protein
MTFDALEMPAVVVANEYHDDEVVLVDIADNDLPSFAVDNVCQSYDAEAANIAVGLAGEEVVTVPAILIARVDVIDSVISDEPDLVVAAEEDLSTVKHTTSPLVDRMEVIGATGEGVAGGVAESRNCERPVARKRTYFTVVAKKSHKGYIAVLYNIIGRRWIFCTWVRLCEYLCLVFRLYFGLVDFSPGKRIVSM